MQDITDQPEALAHRLRPGDTVELTESRPQAGQENESQVHGLEMD